MFGRYTEIVNTSVIFNTLNYPQESINTCNTRDHSEWQSDFSLNVSD